MTECAPGLEGFYRPGREIEVFQDFAELVAKIRYYLSHPEERDEIAWAGFSRTRSEHRYSDRMRTVLEHALQARETSSSEIAAKPFDQALAGHRLSLPLKAVRSLILRAGCLIFGPTRGVRAARRLVFELSWRLVGRHTFTAAGWPGRMFPEC